MNTYLIHYAEGSTKKGHKYVSREWKNGRWKYTYHSPVSSSNKRSEKIKEVQSKLYEYDWKDRLASHRADDSLYEADRAVERAEYLNEDSNGFNRKVSREYSDAAIRYRALSKEYGKNADRAYNALKVAEKISDIDKQRSKKSRARQIISKVKDMTVGKFLGK